MDVIDQLHAPATLLKVKDSSASNEQEAGWVPESVWTFQSTEKYRSPDRYATGNRPVYSLGSDVKEVIYVYVYVCTSFPTEGLKHKCQYSPSG
jgi:hypothetical protein